MVLFWAASATAQTYSTNFSSGEARISEGGRWINGGFDGLDWSDVSTTSGRATGTQQGTCVTGSFAESCYDDSIAALAGEWGPDQTVEATVFSIYTTENPNPHDNDGCNQEVELHLRTSISANVVTTYEVLFNVRKSDLAYTEIVKWAGPLGTVLSDFIFLSDHLTGNGARYGVGNGDRVKASITGNHIEAFIWRNGAWDKINEAWDDSYATGSPGIGFYWGRMSCGAPGTGNGDTSDYGFSSFSAMATGGVPQAPYGGTPWPIPGRVEAEDFDVGGEGVAYHDLSGANEGGAYRLGDGVDVQACTDAGGGYNLGWTRAGEWLEYTVDVAASGLYALDVRAASNGAGGTFHVAMDGVDLTGPIAVTNTGGWRTWATQTLTGISLTSGVRVMSLVFDSEGDAFGMVNVNFLEFRSASCSPEDDAAVCARHGKNCDAFNGTDNCGASRTVSSCGDCGGAETCGGGGSPNVCGAGSARPRAPLNLTVR